MPASIEVLAEAGADGALLNDGELRRQRAGAQQHREVVGLLDGEIAGDLSRAAGDRPEDARRRNDLVVEHDGERTADVLAGDLAEALAAPQVEAEVHVGLAGALIEARLRVDEVFACDHHALLDRELAALLLGQHLKIARRFARVGDQAEFQFRRGAEQILEFEVSCRPGTSMSTRSEPSCCTLVSLVPEPLRRRLSTSID